MSHHDLERESWRGALEQAIRIGETLQGRVDRALELLEPLQLNPNAANAIAVLRGEEPGA